MKNNNNIKNLIDNTDKKINKIKDDLIKIGKLLVEKIKRDTGVEVEFQLGWEEDGIECICLIGKNKLFKNYDECRNYFEKEIDPLFKDTKILHYDIPFTLYEEE